MDAEWIVVLIFVFAVYQGFAAMLAWSWFPPGAMSDKLIGLVVGGTSLGFMVFVFVIFIILKKRSEKQRETIITASSAKDEKVEKLDAKMDQVMTAVTQMQGGPTPYGPTYPPTAFDDNYPPGTPGHPGSGGTKRS